MAKLFYSRVVAAPPKEVFRLAWDLDLQKSLDSRILKYEVVGGGLPVAGSRLNVALAYGGGVLTSEKQVVSVDDEGPVPGSHTIEESGGLRFTCQSRYVPCEEGTRVELSYDVGAASWLGYLVLVVFVLLARFRMGREVRDWFDRLERGLSNKEIRSAVSARVRSTSSGARCPFCHADTEPSDSVACTGCFAKHHTGCWDEHGECASCGSRTRFTGVEETEGRTREPRTDEKG